MGPGTRRYCNNQTSFGQHPQYQHHPQQQPHLLFMAGGSVGGFPQMSRGFSMMPNGGSLNPGVMHCNMQHGFNGGGGGYGGNNGYGYGYPAHSAPIFQQHYHYQHQQQQQQQQPQPQPQLIHHIPPQHFVQQSYISPPPQSPVASTTHRSGFIDGIKNMVKGLIQPLNCDVYSDNHKYYNPKYRNNYMRDITSEIAYPHHHQQKQQSDPHVQAVMIGLEFGTPRVNSQDKKSTTEIPTNSSESSEKTVPLPRSSSPKATDVLAIFTSEDFPELPAPRRSRSMTPAKTEETIPKPAVIETKKEKITEKQSSPAQCSEESTKQQQPTPKSICFEIKCTNAPCGPRPTFGGRLKVVPPPFSFNKCLQACRRSNCQNTTTPHNDCDTEEDSFVLFQTCRPPRQRQISECSDDSFVVFFTDDVDSVVAIDSDIDDDEEDDEDDDDEDDDDGDSYDSLDTDEEEEEDDPQGTDLVAESENGLDNGTDVVDSSFLGRNKTDRNKCTGTTLLYPEVDCDGAEHEQFDSGFDVKKVSFNPNPPVVHVMHAWNFAYRAARKGHWEDFARDRTRFQKRIERTSFYLNPILTPEHREKIYHSRFSEESNKQPSQLMQQTSLPKLATRSPQTTADSNSDDNKKLPKLTESLRCARF